METGNHSKNGAEPKGQKSREIDLYKMDVNNIEKIRLQFCFDSQGSGSGDGDGSAAGGAALYFKEYRFYRDHPYEEHLGINRQVLGYATGWYRNKRFDISYSHKIMNMKGYLKDGKCFFAFNLESRPGEIQSFATHSYTTNNLEDWMVLPNREFDNDSASLAGLKEAIETLYLEINKGNNSVFPLVEFISDIGEVTL